LSKIEQSPVELLIIGTQSVHCFEYHTYSLSHLGLTCCYYFH